MLSRYGFRRSVWLGFRSQRLASTVAVEALETRVGIDNIFSLQQRSGVEKSLGKRGRPAKPSSGGSDSLSKAAEATDSTSKSKTSKLAGPKPRAKKNAGDDPPDALDEESTRSTPAAAAAATARLLHAPGSKHHRDLPSFLTYAKQKKLDKRSNTYKGTHYEYTVAEALEAFDFTLERVGRANDLGIDLIGHWTLPADGGVPAQELRVLVQCKVSRPRPSTIRELAGAYSGAPAGWRGSNVLALLVTSGEATKGVREAMQRSMSPMGVLQVGQRGTVRQLLWNTTAEERGLAGVGVTVKYKDAARDTGEDEESPAENYTAGVKSAGSIALTWMGRPWPVSRL